MNPQHCLNVYEVQRIYVCPYDDCKGHSRSKINMLSHLAAKHGLQDDDWKVTFKLDEEQVYLLYFCFFI